MAKPLVVNLGGVEFPLQMSRVERSDLYGYVEVETLDEGGARCSLATLADDGRTIIGTSGFAVRNDIIDRVVGQFHHHVQANKMLTAIPDATVKMSTGRWRAFLLS